MQDVQFLFRVLQSQNKNRDCWYFNEELGRQQVYLKCYLEACRKLDMIRSYRVSNSQNYFVLKSDNRKLDRPIHIVEPYSQLYQHTQLADGSPSKELSKWKTIKDINSTKMKKNCLMSYNYGTREVEHQKKTFLSITDEKKKRANIEKKQNSEKTKNDKKNNKNKQKEMKRKANNNSPKSSEPKKPKN